MSFEEIIEDSKTAPQTIVYKISNGLATLSDQDEALKAPWTAYRFALDVPGANVEKCQEVACKNHIWAYYFAKYIPEANIRVCQDAVCKNPEWAHILALSIKGVDIRKCRKACEGTRYAF